MTADACAEITARGRFKPDRNMSLYDAGAVKDLGLRRGSTSNGIHGEDARGGIGAAWSRTLNRFGGTLNSVDRNAGGSKVPLSGGGVPAPRLPVVSY